MNADQFRAGQTAPDGRAICGARTRAGTPCRRSPMANGRCNLHGGKTPKGAASPQFKHGRYSKYLPGELAERAHEAATDRELLSLRDEIALVTAFIDSLLEDLRDGADWPGMLAALKDLHELHAEAEAAIEAGDGSAFKAAFAQLGAGIDAALAMPQSEAARAGLIAEVGEQIDRRGRLVASESRRLAEMRQFITVEQARSFVVALTQVVKEVVKERAALAAIADGFTALMNRPELRSRDDGAD